MQKVQMSVDEVVDVLRSVVAQEGDVQQRTKILGIDVV